MTAPARASAAAVPKFAALHVADYRRYFALGLMAMMADNIEHVISYWVIFQKFHSPALGGFAVISHWVPFLLFSVWAGALADRYDCRTLIQIGQGLLLAGVFNIAFTSMAQTLVQVLAPPDIRGSIVGLFNTAQLGLRAGSGVTIGILGAVIGVQWSLTLSAVAVVLVVAVLLARTVGRPRDL